ncbi:unnamed protein product [Staurois parvus]|uniref:Uncharacterized protein n=1 Tax=Staurois parvus TaxID=386267 RepID=A0ABN9F9F2_9NEOB|nr:unnamed protein product [Staurois parvus]
MKPSIVYNCHVTCCSDHVITDWPISDHMNSSKQDVTSDIIAYY